jgi:hypothetical protein
MRGIRRLGLVHEDGRRSRQSVTDPEVVPLAVAGEMLAILHHVESPAAGRTGAPIWSYPVRGWRGAGRGLGN